jgi:hypothetical protein
LRESPFAAAAPPEDDPLRQVYEDFIKAKARLGEKVDKLNFERFKRKLQTQGEAIKEKHKCRSVRFEVVVRDNQVTLRPKILR